MTANPSQPTVIGSAIGAVVAVGALLNGTSFDAAITAGFIVGGIAWAIKWQVQYSRARRRDVAQAKAGILTRAREAESAAPVPPSPPPDYSQLSDHAQSVLRDIHAKRDVRAEQQRQLYRDAIDQDEGRKSARSWKKR